MTRCLVENLHIQPQTLPLPYGRLLPPKGRGVIADTPTNVLAALGGAANIAGVFTLSDCQDSVPATITPMVTSDIANGIVTKAKMAMFVSAVITGNAGAQNTAHGLGVVPAAVFIALVSSPGAFAQATVVEGAHDATNVIVTVAANWVYRIIAIA